MKLDDWSDAELAAKHYSDQPVALILALIEGLREGLGQSESEVRDRVTYLWTQIPEDRRPVDYFTGSKEV